MQRVTLADLARKTGLNVSTVSRALSRPLRVSDETRRQVEKAAAELGYSVNVVARNLSRGTTDTLMVMAPAFAGQALSPVFAEVLLGVCNEAELLGFNVMLHRHPRAHVPTADVLKFLHSGTVDGILLLVADHWDLPSSGWAGPRKPPVISVMRDMTASGLTSVVAREAEGFAGLVDHMVRLGHRDFAYVGGPEDSVHEEIRRSAVADRLAVLGLRDGLVHLPGGPFDMSSGAAAAQVYLALAERPRAVICCSDALAVGFMHGVLQAGLAVPQDVAIAGYDGLDYTAFVTPPLTTVRQPSIEIGRAAAGALVDLIRGHLVAPRLIALSPELIVRAST